MKNGGTADEASLLKRCELETHRLDTADVQLLQQNAARVFLRLIQRVQYFQKLVRQRQPVSSGFCSFFKSSLLFENFLILILQSYLSFLQL